MRRYKIADSRFEVDFTKQHEHTSVGEEMNVLSYNRNKAVIYKPNNKKINANSLTFDVYVRGPSASHVFLGPNATIMRSFLRLNFTVNIKTGL